MGTFSRWRRGSLTSLVLAATLALSACFTAPLSPVGEANKKAITELVLQASKLGFGGGVVERRCGFSLDCRAGDAFSYVTIVREPGLTDGEACSKFFKLAKLARFEYWRTSYNDEIDAAAEDALKGQEQCVRTLSKDEGPGLESEALVVQFTRTFNNQVVSLQMQISSHLTEVNLREHYFVIQTVQ